MCKREITIGECSDCKKKDKKLKFTEALIRHQAKLNKHKLEEKDKEIKNLEKGLEKWKKHYLDVHKDLIKGDKEIKELKKHVEFSIDKTAEIVGKVKKQTAKEIFKQLDKLNMSRNMLVIVPSDYKELKNIFLKKGDGK